MKMLFIKVHYDVMLHITMKSFPACLQMPTFLLLSSYIVVAIFQYYTSPEEVISPDLTAKRLNISIQYYHHPSLISEKKNFHFPPKLFSLSLHHYHN